MLYNLQMSLATVEMSGPLAAVLHQQAASSPSDFQAYLFGQRVLLESSLATDFEEHKKVETNKMVITKFVVAKADDDIQKGNTSTNGTLASILKTQRKSKTGSELEFLGFLNFKKTWSSSWPLTPSHQDCRTMSMLHNTESTKQFHVFHLLAEMATDHSGIRLVSATFLLEKGRESREGPWVGKVTLKGSQFFRGVYLFRNPNFQLSNFLA